MAFKRKNLSLTLPNKKFDYRCVEEQINKIIKFFDVDRTYLKKCLDKLESNNPEQYDFLIKEINLLDGFNYKFLSYLDKIFKFYLSECNFKYTQNYFCDYELQFNGWWHYCNTCRSFCTCNEKLDNSKKLKEFTCDQCNDTITIKF